MLSSLKTSLEETENLRWLKFTLAGHITVCSGSQEAWVVSLLYFWPTVNPGAGYLDLLGPRVLTPMWWIHNFPSLPSHRICKVILPWHNVFMTGTRELTMPSQYKSKESLGCVGGWPRVEGAGKPESHSSIVPAPGREISFFFSEREQ